MARSPDTRLPGPERRALIEAAAARLFSRRGYTATTLDDIAAAAHVTKPVLYRHFASKKDHCLALLALHRDALAAAALRDYEPGRPAADWLPGMLDRWFAYVAAEPDGCRMLLREAEGDPEIIAFQQELRALQRGADMALLRESGIDVPEAELEVLGEVVRSTLTGLGLWALEHPDVPRRVFVEAMLGVCEGLMAAAGGR
jgi:AcrR family transcriptional regulator